MSPGQALVYGVVQGLTEFLPVSSSAHLSLLPWLLGWKDPGLAFDVALHLGTLAALLGYFRKDWLLMLRSLGAPRSEEGRRLWIIAAATLPGVAAGFLLKDKAETLLRAPALSAANLMLFGLALGWADARGRKSLGLESVGLARGLAIGCAQALALVPGVSRSGITLTAGLLLGLDARAAARFSFLLSAPITFGAAALKVPDLGPAFFELPVLLGIAASAASGLWAIRFLLSMLGGRGCRPFVLYRLALGAFILLLSLR